MLESILPTLVAFVIIDLVLKGIAMWYAARAKQTGWYIAILLLNTMGILPAIYLIWFRRGK